MTTAPATALPAKSVASWPALSLLALLAFWTLRLVALPLVGGGDHDWNELFYRFGLLGETSVRVVSTGTLCAGIVLMLLGLAWVAFFALPSRTREALTAAVEGQAPALLFLLKDPRN